MVNAASAQTYVNSNIKYAQNGGNYGYTKYVQ